MYKIINPKNKDEIITENISYAKHSGGVLVATSKEDADGVVHKGDFFPFNKGYSVEEVDAGDVFMPTENIVKAIREGVNSI